MPSKPLAGKTLRLGFMASHGGSAMKAVAQACRSGDIEGEAVLVISNNTEPLAFERARELGIETHHMSGKTHGGEGALDDAICSLLTTNKIDLIVLSGYMRKIGPKTLEMFDTRILNVHPALLPKYGGKGFYGSRVHQAVLDAKESESGATVHLLDSEYDTGPILVQGKVRVLANDTVETLAARVAEIEHSLFIEALQGISSGALDLDKA
jgi:phosphoribosylglycinamide formyltransferase-1